MKLNRIALAVVPVLLLTACASAGSSGSSSSRDVITLEQLQTMPDQSLYDVIRKLKPTWLSKRGQVSFRSDTQMLVVVDEGQYHDLSILNSLTAGNVVELRYMDPRRATTKYGIRANGGAILVSTIS